MKIVALSVTVRNANHSIAKVHWEANYKKKDGTGITTGFDIFYFLQKIDGVPKIFAYITGDEQKFYKEEGLVPD